jgi:hypothetical protein
VLFAGCIAQGVGLGVVAAALVVDAPSGVVYAAAIEGGSVSFTGVDQTTPVRNIVTNAGASTSPTVSVTSAPGDMVVDAMANGCNGTITSRQALRWAKSVNCATGAGNGAQSTAAGAASVTMGYTIPSDWWGIIAMDIVAAGSSFASASPQSAGDLIVVAGQWNDQTAPVDSVSVQPVGSLLSGGR